MKARTGSIVKRKPRRKGAKATWWARVTYVDPKTGKRHDLQRRGQNKAHARDFLSTSSRLQLKPVRRGVVWHRASEILSLLALVICLVMADPRTRRLMK